MENEWFGEIGVFLILFFAVTFLGYRLPEILVTGVENTWIKFVGCLFLGMVILWLVGLILSAIVQSFTQPNLWQAVFENPTGALSYFSETGAELLGGGVITLIGRSVGGLIRSWRRKAFK